MHFKLCQTHRNNHLLEIQFFKGKPVVGEKEKSYQEEKDGKKKIKLQLVIGINK